MHLLSTEIGVSIILRKPYKCDLCDFATTQSTHLTAHKRTHSGEKPYICDKCDYKAAIKGALDAHKLTHSDEYPHQCDKCEYRAEWKSTKTHMLSHRSERKWTCDLCDHIVRKHNRGQYGTSLSTILKSPSLARIVSTELFKSDIWELSSTLMAA